MTNGSIANKDKLDCRMIWQKYSCLVKKKKPVMCDGRSGRGDPKICSYLSEIIIRESFIMREVRPEALALTAEARGVYVSFKILNPELRSGIWPVTAQEEGFGFWQNIKPNDNKAFLSSYPNEHISNLKFKYLTTESL